MEAFRLNDINEIKRIMDRPAPPSKKGRVAEFAYPSGKHGIKHAMVYTPWCYDEKDINTRYDILYMMHGANSGIHTFLWDEGTDSHFKNILDHAIAAGEIRPLIVVTPGLYPDENVKKYKGQEADLASEFTDELVKKLMVSVESMYMTWADSMDHEGFKASRGHRAFGGFSMGAVVTWYTLARHLDYFSTFMPVCGDCWQKGRFGGEKEPEATARWLADSVSDYLTNGCYSPLDYRIYCATGAKDMALPGMTNQLGAMKNYPEVFRPGEGFGSECCLPSEGSNLYYILSEAGEHDYKWAASYFYSALKAWLGPAGK